MGHPEIHGASCLAKHESRTCFFSVSTGVTDPQGDETGSGFFSESRGTAKLPRGLIVGYNLRAV
jgi:hypothetical protein